jgi:hypothetical protein
MDHLGKIPSLSQDKLSSERLPIPTISAVKKATIPVPTTMANICSNESSGKTPDTANATSDEYNHQARDSERGSPSTQRQEE